MDEDYNSQNDQPLGGHESADEEESGHMEPVDVSPEEGFRLPGMTENNQYHQQASCYVDIRSSSVVEVGSQSIIGAQNI